MHPIYAISPLYSDADVARMGNAQRKSGDLRDSFETDRARIIHSFAFRRLQSKTQIFGLNESAFLRTRLTHSLEVANIGRALTAVVNRAAPPFGTATDGHGTAERLPGPVDTSLVEAACLAHDLGHPPFGHRGEEALNHAVWTRWPDRLNGFEGNGQTLRVLTNENLEVHAERHGLNLTRATLLAVLKYPALYRELIRPDAYPEERAAAPPFKPWAPPKCIHNEEEDVLEWLIAGFPDADDQTLFREVEKREGRHGRARYKTLEASIVELADDIAYGTHDVEDAFFTGLASAETVLGYLDRARFRHAEAHDRYASLIRTMSDGRPGSSRRDAAFDKKGAASELTNALISAVTLEEDDRFSHPRLRWTVTLPEDERLVLDALKRSIYDRVINGPQVQSLEYRGGIIISALFQAFWTSPELLSGRVKHRIREAPDEQTALRALTDYIAGMTDSYAERMYQRLFQPGIGSIFDRV